MGPGGARRAGRKSPHILVAGASGSRGTVGSLIPPAGPTSPSRPEDSAGKGRARPHTRADPSADPSLPACHAPARPRAEGLFPGCGPAPRAAAPPPRDCSPAPRAAHATPSPLSRRRPVASPAPALVRAPTLPAGAAPRAPAVGGALQWWLGTSSCGVSPRSFPSLALTLTVLLWAPSARSQPWWPGAQRSSSASLSPWPL